MVVNLQEVGEHASCGPGNLQHTGFTYDPATLHQHEISYCPMAWPDMKVPALPHVLKIVQVMHKVVELDKKKVAVHCHAGLGRTGLVIACYMVFSFGCSGTYAIQEVRKGRRGALQTHAQEVFVLVFETWIQHLRCCVPPAETCKSTAKLWDEQLRVCCVRYPRPKAWTGHVVPPSTLDEMIDRQKMIMHGRLVQHYCNVPELLLHLLQVDTPCSALHDEVVISHDINVTMLVLCGTDMRTGQVLLQDDICDKAMSASDTSISCPECVQGICSKLHSLACECEGGSSLPDALGAVRACFTLPEDPEEVSKLAVLRTTRRRLPCAGLRKTTRSSLLIHVHAVLAGHVLPICRARTQCDVWLPRPVSPRTINLHSYQQGYRWCKCNNSE